jgi:C1A family cysteine protease
MDVNQTTDRPKSEWDVYICNIVPSKETERDWTYADSVSAGLLAAPAALPTSVDLRAPWWTINNQESTGSCVGWAVADGVVRYHMVQAGRISQNELLSARHIWMASKETDEFTSRPQTFIEEAGTSLKAAADVARKHGTALAVDLPFHIATNMFLGGENAFYANCAQRKITAYFNLQKDPAIWKIWLATKGPILAALQVDTSWDNAKATGGKIDAFVPPVRGGHAITVVGYQTDGRFIVRNSWGTGWGDQGFGYVSQAYIDAGFFSEAYGVVA